MTIFLYVCFIGLAAVVVIVAVGLAEALGNATRCQRMSGLVKVEHKSSFPRKENYVLIDGFMHLIVEPESYELECSGHDSKGRSLRGCFAVSKAFYARVNEGSFLTAASGELSLLDGSNAYEV